MLAIFFAASSSVWASDTFPGTTISGAVGSTTGNNNTGWSGAGGKATGETGEPTTYTATGELNTLWYSWTAPGNGTVTFETCSSTLTTFDTTLQSFTGTAVNSLSQQATNDDTTGCATTGSTGLASRITWNVTSGTVYRIQVDGYNSLRGAFRLAWSFTGFTLTKTPSVSSISAPGTITYTITVANTGGATLSGITISDSLSLSASARTLTSGPTRTSGDTNSNNQIETTETWVYTATYAVPQSDIDLGGTYSNTATFDTTQTIAYTSSSATTSITQSPNYTITKAQTSGSNPVTAAGQSIGYTISVANTGNVTLTSPSLTSDTFQLGGSAKALTSGPSYASGDTDSDGNIDVGETWLYTASYNVVQADLDATGNFTNVASYSTTQAGAKTSATLTTNVTRSPSFVLTKSQSGGPSPVTLAGQTLSYQISVQNNGNQTLTGLTISDTLLQAGSPRTLATGPTFASGDTDSDGRIDVGETWTYTASYIVQLTDMNNGGTFSNTATFDTAQTAPSTSAAVTTAVSQLPSLQLVKNHSFTVDNGTVGKADAGDVIAYTYNVTNNGNVTVTNISVADLANGSGPLPAPLPASVASLAPAATVQFTTSYTVTQQDVDTLQ